MLEKSLGAVRRTLHSLGRWAGRDTGATAAREAAAAAAAEAPVIWLLGKTQAGKTSIVSAITGEGRDDIGNGFQPATRTARQYAWPKERPLLRFLDTRGLADSAVYDPAEDIAFAENQAHLIIAVVRAEDMALGAVIEPLRAARKRHPDWPVIVAQTRLHDFYPAGFTHRQPWPFGDPALPGLPDGLRAALRHQRGQFAAIERAGTLRFVPIDFTLPEDGLEPALYGVEALREALAHALPDARYAILLPRREIARAVQGLIVSYAVAAAAGAAVPLPGLGVAGPAVSQSLMLRALAGRYGLTWSRATWTRFAGALGAGALSGFGLAAGLRELTKLIPGVGMIAGGASAGAAGFATTYALGIAACHLLEAEREGAALPDRALAETYAKALREAFALRGAS